MNNILRVRFLVLAVAVTVLILLPALSSAQGPGLPCRFHGTVQLDGAPVPDGTVITATIEGNISTTTTPSVYGDSTYAIIIVPPQGTIFNDGTPITFKIGDFDAIETGTWETGLNLILNLTASSAAMPTPTPLETVTPPETPMPTATPLPTASPSTTPAPTPTPTPTPPSKAPLNIGRVVGLALFGLFDVLLIGLLVYLVWRFYIRK